MEIVGDYPGLRKLKLKVPPTLNNVYHFLTTTKQRDVDDIEYRHNIFVINRDKEIKVEGALGWILVWRHSGEYFPVVLKKEGGYGTIFEDVKFLKPYDCLVKKRVVANPAQARVAKLFLQGMKSLALKWDTGTGKTLAAAFTAECLLRKGVIRGVVVVSPKSLKTNFRETISRYGGNPERYHIVGYDRFSLDYNIAEDPTRASALKIFMKDMLLIVDEAHNLRTKIKFDQSGRLEKGKKAYNMIKAAKYAKRVLLLTATPLMNRRRDVCNLVDMLRRSGEFNTDKDIELGEFTHLIAGRFSVNEREKSDSDFPKMNIEYIDVVMTREQREGYVKLLSDMDKRIDFDPDIFFAGRRIGNNFIDISHKAKLIVDKLLEKPIHRRKSLIFSNYKASGIELVKKIMKDKGLRVKIISGDIDEYERDRNKRAFDKYKIDALLMTSAGGEGLDFKGTNNIFIMESEWNFGVMRQKIGRGVRYKSHQPGETVDIYILKALSSENPDDPLFTGDSILEDISYKKEVDIQEAEEIMRKTSIESELGMRVIKQSEDIFDRETYLSFGGVEY